jgi:protein arginine N-methyltransferase 1
MEWNEIHTVSRALVFQVGDQGEVLVRRSLSGGTRSVDRRRLQVLMAFAGGRTPREAFSSLGPAAGFDEAGFAEVFDALVGQRLLLTAAGTGPVPASLPTGFGSTVIHFPMIRDSVRVLAYRRAIARHCRGRTVVEVGCGSGILSIFAAQAGARRVVAIEESEIADVAAEMFRTNGVEDVVELRRANSRDVTLDEPAEVLIHEVLGADPVEEAVLPSIVDARERLLAPGGRLIPYAVDVYCVGFELPERPVFDPQKAGFQLAELGGLYGLDLGAFHRALATEVGFRRPPIGDLGQDHFTPPILTDEALLYTVDFRPGASLEIQRRDDIRLRVTRAGGLDGVLVYFRARLDEETVLSTAPFAPRTSWHWNARMLERLVSVQPGMEVPILVELRTFNGVECVHVGLA